MRLARSEDLISDEASVTYWNAPGYNSLLRSRVAAIQRNAAQRVERKPNESIPSTRLSVYAASVTDNGVPEAWVQRHLPPGGHA